MAMNRQQRRAAKHKGKRQGETYMDVLTQKKMIKEAVEQSVHDQSVALESDIKTQRLLWMSIVALNRAYGYAGVRSQRYMMTMDEVREELEQMAKENGWDYAIEKLRQAAEKITGMEVKQVHEEAMRRARAENEANGIFFPAEDPDAFSETDFAPLFDQKKGPAWIPVSERLPEHGQEVIVYTGNILKPIVMAYTFWNPKYDTWAHVTHWMPMPEGPEEVS